MGLIGSELRLQRIIVTVLVISLLGNLIGLYFASQWLLLRRQEAAKERLLGETNKGLLMLAGAMDNLSNGKMIFLHHSVGSGILDQGGLRDGLMKMGISVRSATYGDSIGEQTDMCDWMPKFRSNMEAILKFRAHPNLYFNDSSSNDIVMFKSCFPNSQIEPDGSAPGDPLSRQKTIANYKAVFVQLQQEFGRYPDKLFVYLTFPPLLPSVTNAESASRVREFNCWLQGPYLTEYRKETGLQNLVIFDLFDALADQNGFLKEAYRVMNPGDSHPNLQANREVAKNFMEYFRPVWISWKDRTKT